MSGHHTRIHAYDIHPYIAFLTCVVIGENIIIDFNAFHHSNHLRLLLFYTGHVNEKKTVEFVYVAICVKSYRLNTVLHLEHLEEVSTHARVKG